MQISITKGFSWIFVICPFLDLASVEYTMGENSTDCGVALTVNL